MKLTLLALVGTALFAQKGATIAGQVWNEKGEGVGGAFVVLVQEAQAGAKTPMASMRNATVEPGGRYGFSGLAPGKYRVCAELGHIGYASPCAWGGGASVTVAGSEIQTEVNVRATKGRWVRVRVTDPKKLGAAADVAKKPVRFQVQMLDGKNVVAIARELKPNERAKGQEADRVWEAMVPVGKVAGMQISSDIGKLKLQGKTDVADGLKSVDAAKTDGDEEIVFEIDQVVEVKG